MIAAVPVLRAVGLHVLPGIICLVLSAVLLSLWEVRRISHARVLMARPWLLPTLGITLGMASCVLIAARFLAVA